MSNQTIPLPSGVTISIKVEEARPLEQWTDVEIHERIESLRIERRKVQYRRDEEAVHVRTVAKAEAKRLRGELSRRKRESTPCPVCGDLGYIGQAPDGEHCYCSGCARGLHLHLDDVRVQMDAASLWLRGLEGGGSGERYQWAQENLHRLVEEFDEIKARWDLLSAGPDAR